MSAGVICAGLFLLSELFIFGTLLIYIGQKTFPYGIFALAILGIFAVLFLYPVSVSAKILGFRKIEYEKLRAQKVKDIFANARQIFIYHKIDFLINALSTTAHKLKRVMIVNRLIEATPRILLELIALLMLLAAALLLMEDGKVDASAAEVFVLVVAVMSRLLPSSARLITFFNTIRFNLGSLEFYL